MSRKKKPFLFLVVFFATLLLLLSFWVIRQNIHKPFDSLSIHNVLVTSDLNSKLRLTGSVSRFPYGIRQVYLAFEYRKAEEESDIRILWYCGEKLVQSDTYPLTSPSGTKVYCLVRENGQVLPKGAYAVSILDKTERIQDFKFEIY